ncbi:hypothetical protein P12x_001031 [Tundrisphaera lichenicola]|uniref:hypothetical protein n=1 Tax=Tundrisphaera lichenicola TaxID=2029860 RepID=UPI003EB89091
MINLGDLDGRFEFFAVVTPDGKIPTVEEDSTLNEPSVWYTSPIGTIAHLSDFALVFTDREDASDELEKFRGQLPLGTRIRSFSVVVEEFDESLDDSDEAES